MKKLLYLLVFAFAASAIQAQNNDMYSLLYHDQEGFVYGILGVMQQRDGDIITNTYVLEDIGNFNYIPSGNAFYKISPTSLAITDSLFIADTTSFYLSMQNPNGEGNIRVDLEFHEDSDSTFLRISHFHDSDFNVNPEEDVVVALCEDSIYGYFSFIDCRGDLILTYTNFDHDVYVTRFDIDGTLKHHSLLHENTHECGPLRVFKESPLQYYQQRQGNGNPNSIIVCVMDSLFNKNPVIINPILSEEVIDPFQTEYEYLYDNGISEVIPCGGDDILVSAQYINDINFFATPEFGEFGVAVAKYDTRTMQRKGYIVFNDYPSIYRPAQCLGLKMMSDGTVYFLYKETGYPDESFIAVKMDTDLNVEWKRFCKTDISIESLDYCILYKDEQGEEQGIAWVGNGTNTSTNKMGLVLLSLNHDGPVGINESSIEVRPYAFYPNPVKEQLHMQFSPDVRPAQVELYDLQGRLLRTQGNNFESIDLSLLPDGTYMMRVTLENGDVYSDKVVKE